jgi:hypothetical protein
LEVVRLAKVEESELFGEPVIFVRLDPDDARVCDYCNDVLIVFDDDAGALKVVKRCHSTSYGLMCDKCRGKIKAIRTYELGELVRADFWGNLEKIGS